VPCHFINEEAAQSILNDKLTSARPTRFIATNRQSAAYHGGFLNKWQSKGNRDHLGHSITLPSKSKNDRDLFPFQILHGRHSPFITFLQLKFSSNPFRTRTHQHPLMTPHHLRRVDSTKGSFQSKRYSCLPG
jgi:hypothetical protein